MTGSPLGFEDTPGASFALGCEDSRRQHEHLALLLQLAAALYALVKRRRDIGAAYDVYPESFEKVEAAEGTKVISSAENLDTQFGEAVIPPAVLAPRHGVVEAVDDEDSALGVRQHCLPDRSPYAATHTSATDDGE